MIAANVERRALQHIRSRPRERGDPYPCAACVTPAHHRYTTPISCSLLLLRSMGPCVRGDDQNLLPRHVGPDLRALGLLLRFRSAIGQIERHALDRTLERERRNII